MITMMMYPQQLLLISICLSTVVDAYSWSLADRILGRAPAPRAFLRRTTTSTALQSSQSPQYSAEQYFSWVGDNANDLIRTNDDALELVKTIVQAADGRKAENIVALYVAPITTMARYLIVVSGNSRPQNQAIANAVKKDVEESFQIRPGSTGVPEGSADSGWMLLDFGSVMVHVMTPKSRLYYNIEGQWLDKGGKVMDVTEYMIPNPALAQANEASSTEATDAAPENDPFWS